MIPYHAEIDARIDEGLDAGLYRVCPNCDAVVLADDAHCGQCQHIDPDYIDEEAA